MPIIKSTNEEDVQTNDSQSINQLIKNGKVLVQGQPSSTVRELANGVQSKEECIKRQGTIQAAMQSPGLVAWAQNYEDYKRLVRDFAEFAIQFVENK